MFKRQHHKLYHHTYAWPGEISDTDTLPGFYYYVDEGRRAFLMMSRQGIESGTSATYKWQVGGSDATGFTSIATTTTASTTDPTDVELSAGWNFIQPVVTAVSGTPSDFSATMVIKEM